MKKLFGVLVFLIILCACSGISALVTTAALSMEDIDMNVDGEVVAGKNRTISSGETINEDVVIFGGNLTQEADSEINGDLVVFGGYAKIDGRVDGDVVIFGGNVDLGPLAHVDGDIGIMGGNLNESETATVEGEVHIAGGNHNKVRADKATPEHEEAKPAPTAKATVEELEDEIADLQDELEDEVKNSNRQLEEELEQELADLQEELKDLRKELRQNFDDDDDSAGAQYNNNDSVMGGVFGTIFGFIGSVISTIILLLAISAISWLVAAVLPEQMKTTSDTAMENLPLTFGIGFGTILVVGIVSVILVFTFCLAPVSMVAWVIMGAAILFGLISMGQVIGERLLVALDQPFPNFTTSTIVGMVVLTIISQISEIIGALFCIGGILGFLSGIFTIAVASIGLGAVILTRFGTQPFDGSNYQSPYSGGGNKRPRTQWPDPDLDIDEEDPKPTPTEPAVDLDK